MTSAIWMRLFVMPSRSNDRIDDYVLIDLGMILWVVLWDAIFILQFSCVNLPALFDFSLLIVKSLVVIFRKYFCAFSVVDVAMGWLASQGQWWGWQAVVAQVGPLVRWDEARVIHVDGLAPWLLSTDQLAARYHYLLAAGRSQLP